MLPGLLEKTIALCLDILHRQFLVALFKVNFFGGFILNLLEHLLHVFLLHQGVFDALGQLLTLFRVDSWWVQFVYNLVVLFDAVGFEFAGLPLEEVAQDVLLGHLLYPCMGRALVVASSLAWLSRFEDEFELLLPLGLGSLQFVYIGFFVLAHFLQTHGSSVGSNFVQFFLPVALCRFHNSFLVLLLFESEDGYLGVDLTHPLLDLLSLLPKLFLLLLPALASGLYALQDLLSLSEITHLFGLLQLCLPFTLLLLLSFLSLLGPEF